MKCAILGAGNAGQTIAAYLKLCGCETALFNRSESVITKLKERNSIELTGCIEGTAVIDTLSDHMRDVVVGAEIIFVTVPADAQEAVVVQTLEYLEDGQIIVLMPGRLGGTSVISQLLSEQKVSKKVILCETDTLIFTCREISCGVCHIFARKEIVKIAAHDPNMTDYVLDKLSPFFKELVKAESVLETGMANIGMLFHPAPFLMNLSRIERKQKFLYYKDGITPKISGLIEKIDEERMKLASRLGVKIPDVKDWLRITYHASGDHLYDLIQSVSAYDNVYAPEKIESRYIYEDVKTGLVPMVKLGHYYGIDMPASESVIKLATVIYGEDFFANGRECISDIWKQC